MAPLTAKQATATPPPALKDNIQLATPKGEKIILTPARLERALSAMPHAALVSDAKNERLGLQHALDVIHFLKSHAGKSVLGKIEVQLAEIAALEEEQHFQLRERELRRHRIMSFLLSALLLKRAKKAHALNASIQQQIDLILRKAAEKATLESLTKHESHLAPHNDLWDDTLQTYGQAAETLNKHLNDKISEAQQLNTLIASLDHQEKQMIERYNAHDLHLVAINEDLELALINDVSNAQLLPLFNNKVEQAHFKITELRQKLSENQKQIGSLLSADHHDPEQLRAHINLGNNLNLQAGWLKDIISVFEGKSSLYTEQGELAKSFAEAMFITPSDKKIVKDGDKYYLIRVNQNINEMSLEEKMQGEHAYSRNRASLMSVASLAKHNRGLEKENFHEKKASLLATSEVLQHELLLLANQLTQIQAIRSHVAALSEQQTAASATTPTTPAPTLRPTPTSTSAKLISSNVTVGNSYKEALMLMNHRPSQKSLVELERQWAQYSSSPELQAARQALTSIRAGAPIPSETMRSLLANIERFGISAHKPNIANAINPTPNLERVFHPTPFAMKPPGF